MSDEVIKFAMSPSDWISLQKHERVVSKETSDHQPGVVYVNGFKSVMDGQKVTALRQWAVNKNVDFLVYDHYGHGQSSGEFKDATVGRWYHDLCLVLEQQTQGPQILVGCSMGFWLALLVILRAQRSLKRRITGLLGIAPALNFTESLMIDMTETQLEFEGGAGMYRRQSAYSETGFYDIPINLLIEGKHHCVVPPYEVGVPVRLIHGLQDSEVAYTETLALLKDLQSEHVDVLLVKDGDHRLSREEDLEKIVFLLDNLLVQVGAHIAEDEPVIWRDNPLQRWDSQGANPSPIIRKRGSL
ncbi:hypothetical protein R1flu_023860 [Riccia fluitans]|uniref:Serine aminopeptidase S33 domain-containing protein n=1 Tax=Riccia fluitans TaxID=41844 RepID=A0ABD1XU29_9MARC